MGEFNPINSQEELDAIIKGRIDRERKATAEKYADYEELKNSAATYEGKIAELTKALEDANTTIAGHNSVVDELNAKIGVYETKETKLRIAREVGLSPELADRINGTDETTMKADAEILAKAFKVANVPPLAIVEPNITKETATDMALKDVAKKLFN